MRHRLLSILLLLAGAGAPAQNTSLEQANRLAAAGQYREALAEYGKALATDPQSAEAYYRRGVVHYLLKLEEKAKADLEKALAIAPRHAPGLTWRGIVRFYSGDHGGAIGDLTRAAGIDDKNPVSFYYRGRARQAAGKSSEAMTDYSRALAIDPKFKDALEARGRSYCASGEYRKGIADYDHWIEVAPRDKYAHFERGHAHLHLKDYGKAVTDFTQALAIDAAHLPSLYWRGVAHFEIQEFAAARQDFTAVIKGKPDHAGAHYWRGRATYRTVTRSDDPKATEVFEAAIADLHRALKLTRNGKHKEVVQKYLAWAIYLRGKVEEATNPARALERYYTLSLRMHEWPQVLADRAALRMNKGDRPGAFADLGTAIRLDPSFALAYTRRGIYRVNAGDYRGALEDLEKARGLDPRNPEAYYHLACCHAVAASSRLGAGRRALIDAAYAALDRAIAGGFRDLRLLRGNQELDPLRSDPRWSKVARLWNK